MSERKIQTCSLNDQDIKKHCNLWNTMLQSRDRTDIKQDSKRIKIDVNNPIHIQLWLISRSNTITFDTIIINNVDLQGEISQYYDCFDKRKTLFSTIMSICNPSQKVDYVIKNTKMECKYMNISFSLNQYDMKKYQNLKYMFNTIVLNQKVPFCKYINNDTTHYKIFNSQHNRIPLSTQCYKCGKEGIKVTKYIYTFLCDECLTQVAGPLYNERKEEKKDEKEDEKEEEKVKTNTNINEWRDESDINEEHIMLKIYKYQNWHDSKKFTIKKKYKSLYYTNIYIVKNENDKVTILCEFSDKDNLTVNYLRNRLNSVFNKKFIVGKQVKLKKMEGQFYFPNQRILFFIFSRLIMSKYLNPNPVFYVYEKNNVVNNNTKNTHNSILKLVYKKNNTLIRFTISSIKRNTKDDISKTYYALQKNKYYTVVKISKISKNISVDSINHFIGKLNEYIKLYNEEYSKIDKKDIYEQKDNDFNLPIQYYIPKIYPVGQTLFQKGYNPKKPNKTVNQVVIKERQDFKENELKEIHANKNARTILFPRKNDIPSYFPEEKSYYDFKHDAKNNLNQYYLTCIDNQYKYIGLGVYNGKYIPGCYKNKKQGNKRWDEYFNKNKPTGYIDEKKQKRSFKQSNKKGVFEYIMPYTYDGIIKCLTNITEKKVLITQFSKKEYELSRQEMYDYSFEEVQNYINNKYWIDPRLFYSYLQYSFQVNLLILKPNSDKKELELVLPNYSKSYYRYKNNNPYVLLYEYYDKNYNKPYPRYNIIVERKNKNLFTKNDPIVSFWLSKFNQSVSSFNYTKQIVPIEINKILKFATSQWIDSNGKCRCLTIKFKNTIFTVCCDPIPPLCIKSENHKNTVLCSMNKRSIVSFFENCGASIIRHYERYTIGIINGVTFTVYTQFNEYYTTYYQNKKHASLLLQNAMFLFAREYKQNNINANNYIEQFMTRQTVIKPTHFYTTNTPFFQNNNGFINDNNKLIVNHSILRDRITYAMKIAYKYNLNSITECKKYVNKYANRIFDNLYENIRDFNKQLGTVLLVNKQQYDMYIQKNITHTVYNNIKTISKPYFIKSKNAPVKFTQTFATEGNAKHALNKWNILKYKTDEPPRNNMEDIKNAYAPLFIPEKLVFKSGDKNIVKKCFSNNFIDILTYNINYNNISGRKQQLMKTIEIYDDYDFICLQEVLEKLEPIQKMRYDYCDYKQYSLMTYWNKLKYKLVKSETVPLLGRDGVERPMKLFVFTDLYDLTILLIHLHMPHHKTHTEIVNTLTQYIDKYKKQYSFDTIFIAGDFNTDINEINNLKSANIIKNIPTCFSKDGKRSYAIDKIFSNCYPQFRFVNHDKNKLSDHIPIFIRFCYFKQNTGNKPVSPYDKVLECKQ